MAERNTRIRASQIRSVFPNDLEATNALVDNYVPSYDLATGKFTWIAVAGGVSQLSDLSDVGVTTPTDKNVLVADGDSWESRALVEADISDLGTYLENLLEDTTPQLGGDLDLNGKNIDFPSVANISDVKDEDNMASDSATMLATQQSIKAYVDSLTGIDDFTIKRSGGNLKIADRIEYNIMLLAFYRAVDNSKSIYNLLDGFIDEYEDETGIDTGASTNEDYDSTNDLYSPTGGGGGIDNDTVLMLHLNNNVTDNGNGSVTGGHTVTNNSVTFDAGTKKWGSHSGVFNGSGANLTIPDSVDWDVVGSNLDDWTIDLWVKHTDHVGDEGYVSQYEDGTHRWHFAHEHGANGLRFVVLDGGQILNLVGGEITDTNWHHVCLIKVADKYGIYKDGTQVAYVQDDSTVNLTGSLFVGSYYSGVGYLDANVDEIRIQHSNIFDASPLSASATGYPDTITIPTEEYASPTVDNMSLISNSQIAEASPSDARIVIFEEDVDAITVNTDIKAYITRENGTGATWEQVTLVDEGNYEGSKRVLAGVVNLDVTGMGVGTDIAYKIETLNNKDLKLHGTGVNFD